MKKRFQLFAKLVALFLAVFTLAGCFQRSVVVTFNTNGGSAITEQIIAVGGTVDMPDDPTKTGYDFSGWFQDVDLTSSFSETTTVEENLTLYAKWTPKNYTVSWDTVGGNDIDPTTVPYRGNIARPSPNPTKEGFVFAGWYEDAAYTTAFSTNKTMPYNNITFYARWSEGEFSLAFDSKGGAPITPIEGTYGDELTLPEPTRVGYTFAGWYEEETYETLFVSETIPSRSMTLYAKWQPVSITVTFVEYEGVSTTATVLYNQPVSEPTPPTRTGYTFAGWELRETGGNTDYVFTTPVTTINGLSIWAKWTANPYTIVFEENGGSSVADITVPYQSTITTPPTPTRTGYTFGGWYSDNGTFAEPYVFSTMPLNGKTLFAKWTARSFTISFNTYQGTNVAPITLSFGSSLTPPSNPTKEGYSFMGWYRESSYTNAYVFPSTMAAESITLHARWSIDAYSLTYMVDGDSYQTINVDYNTPLTPIAEPTKAGYTFSGWSMLPENMPAEAVTITGSFTANEDTPYAVEHYVEKLDGTGYSLDQSIPKQGTTDILVSESALSVAGFTFDEDHANNLLSGTIAGNGSLVLKLYYSRNSYTLTYQVDGEEYVVSSRKFGASIPSLTPPTRTGYTFGGWVGEPTLMPASDVIVSGSFTINSYALHVTSENEDKGTVVIDPNQSSVDYNTSITVTATPHAGYQFSGWDDGTGTVSTSLVYTFSMPDGDVTLLAVFAPETDVTYTVYHYLEKIDGSGYTEQTPAEIKSGTTDMPVSASSKIITGFTFDSTHTNNVLSGTIAGDGSLVLSVYYSRTTYTLTYEVDGEAYDTQTWKYGATVTPLAEPTQTGYTFSGWSNVPSTMPASNTIVTGTFSINSYSLTYMVDGVSHQTSNVEYNTPLTPIAEPTKAGYTFSGWSMLPENMPAEAVTVTGTFDAIDYTITYQLDGGQFDSAQPATYTIETTPFVILNPTKTGYLFTGWTFEGQSEPIKPLTISIGSIGNRTLIAHWTTVLYSVAYYDGAESLSLSPATYTIEGGFDLPNAPEKTGYTFDGWYISSDYSGTAITSIETGTNGALTFYAKYNVNQYSITYYDGAVILDDPSLYYFLFEYGDSFTLNPYAKIGYTFDGWYSNPELTGSVITTVESSVVNDLALYAKFTLNSYDVEFYTENGNLIDVLYGVNFGTLISLNDAFAGEPDQVQALIDLNTNIVKLKQDAIDSGTFSAYLQANAASLMMISNTMTNAVGAVAASPSPETIGSLFVASSTELARLGKALDVKISLLQDAKALIEAAVADEAGTTGAGVNLVIYSNAVQGAFSAYSVELATSLQAFLAEPTNFFKLQDFFSFVNYELSSASFLRIAYQNNYPPKEGYHFVGWVLGSETIYQGEFVSGVSVNAPAATSGRAKLIASYNQINSIMPSFTQGNSLLQWTALSSSITDSLYNSATETVEVEYEIYMKMMVGEEESIVLLSTTTSTSAILVSPGTYEVLVIPVVKIYEGGQIARAITANLQNSSGLSVTVKKAETTAVIEQSGQYYHRILETISGSTEYVYYFFSNTEITFTGADFTILSGNEYVTIQNGNTLLIGSEYSLGENDVRFTFTATDGGTVYTGRIFAYLSQFGLGESLVNYQTTTGSIESSLYYDKTTEPYYIGVDFLSGSGYVDVLENGNGFYFPIIAKTMGGRSMQLDDNMIQYTFYRIVEGVEDPNPVTISESTVGEWEIWRNGRYFYFHIPEMNYRVQIQVHPAYYPAAINSYITSKSFYFTTNEGINVYTNAELQMAYADLDSQVINLHSNIKAELQVEQTYIDPDDGILYPYNIDPSAVVALYNSNPNVFTGNVYQRVVPAAGDQPNNQLIINGNYFVIDGSDLPVTNYSPDGITLNGYGQVGGLTNNQSYRVRNVQVSIFHNSSTDVSGNSITYDNPNGIVQFNNLTILGNTQTPSVNFSTDQSQIEASIELMSRNSGGYVGIGSYYGTQVSLDNVVIGATTIAVTSAHHSIATINNATIYNSWANSIYGHGFHSVSIQNSNIGTSGGAAIHLEDTLYSKVYAQTVLYDTSTVTVNNWVSGEESWFKAYAMELAAMRLKSQVNTQVKDGGIGSILRTMTDASTGLTSRKMNFIFLIMPVSQQLSYDEYLYNNTAPELRSNFGYTDMVIQTVQSTDLPYQYDMPLGDSSGRYVVPISEDFFALTGQPALPFGEIIPTALPSGTSDVGTLVYNNQLGFQADMSSAFRGHCIAVVGLDMYPQPQ